MFQIKKYPRTQHIEGSRLQPGDEDLDSVPFARLKGRHLVIEEKVDGANTGISMSESGELRLQSRGHYLVGGRRERHFSLFKQWAMTQVESWEQILGQRYLMFGEWLYAKHTLFYDQLPHYFQEFDILDRQTGQFLSTEKRRRMTGGFPLYSVRVLHEGPLEHVDELKDLIGPSAFQSDHFLEKLREHVVENGLDLDKVMHQTDVSGLMEGLYIKVEEDGVVKERYKFVRHDFLTSLAADASHWMNRPIIPNQLTPGADIFGRTDVSRS
ncbi:MAG: RNA ligase family protein [Planctomycetota bacterium]